MYLTDWRTDRESLASWRARGTSVRTLAPAPVIDLDVFARQHSRIPQNAADEQYTVILQYLEAATGWAERYTGRALMQQTWTYTLDAPPWCGTAIYLPKLPVISVTSVVSYNASDVPTTMSAVTGYAVDTNRGWILLREGQSWPSDLRYYQSIVVTYVAGYGSDPMSVPTEFHQAISLIAAYFYDHRGDDTREIEDVYRAAGRLIDPYRTAAVL